MANTRLKTRIEELERRQPAARACVSTQFDRDALELYPIQFELHGKTYPDHTVFEQTSIAIRGRELVYQICGPIIPVHKEPKWNQRTSASREFKCWFEAVEVSWRAHWWGVESDARGAPEAWAYGQDPELGSEPDPHPIV